MWSCHALSLSQALRCFVSPCKLFILLTPSPPPVLLWGEAWHAPFNTATRHLQQLWQTRKPGRAWMMDWNRLRHGGYALPGAGPGAGCRLVAMTVEATDAKAACYYRAAMNDAPWAATSTLSHPAAGYVSSLMRTLSSHSAHQTTQQPLAHIPPPSHFHTNSFVSKLGRRCLTPPPAAHCPALPCLTSLLPCAPAAVPSAALHSLLRSRSLPSPSHPVLPPPQPPLPSCCAQPPPLLTVRHQRLPSCH